MNLDDQFIQEDFGTRHSFDAGNQFKVNEYGAAVGDETGAPFDPIAALRDGKVVRMRALITPKEAGIIIGKGGAQVAEFRDNSGARIVVSGQVPGINERILTVTGSLDSNSKAFSLIAAKLIPYLDSYMLQFGRSQQQQNQEGDPRYPLRLLVPSSRVGVIIGKAGFRIKELQEETGCRVFAQPENLVGSTERIINVTGLPDQVHDAVMRIGLLVGDYAEKTPGTILYTPQPAQMMPGYPQMMVNPYGHPGNQGRGIPYPPGYGGSQSGVGMGGNPAAFMMGQGMGGSQMSPAGYGYVYPSAAGASMNMGSSGPYKGGPQGTPQNMGAGGNVGWPMHPAGAMKSEQILVPDDVVGVIIGKKGSGIMDIRQNTGCQVMIYKSHLNWS